MCLGVLKKSGWFNQLEKPTQIGSCEKPPLCKNLQSGILISTRHGFLGGRPCSLCKLTTTACIKHGTVSRTRNWMVGYEKWLQGLPNSRNGFIIVACDQNLASRPMLMGYAFFFCRSFGKFGHQSTQSLCLLWPTTNWESLEGTSFMASKHQNMWFSSVDLARVKQKSPTWLAK